MTATSLNWQAQRIDAAAQRILDAAEALYATHGVDGVTMRDLAAAAGCSRATLYRYFPSRETVQTAFVDRSADRLAHEVAAADRGRRRRRSSDRGGHCRTPSGARQSRIRQLVPARRGRHRRPARRRIAGDRVARTQLRRRLAWCWVHAGTGAGSDAERARWLVRVMLSLLTTREPIPMMKRRCCARSSSPSW